MYVGNEPFSYIILWTWFTIQHVIPKKLCIPTSLIIWKMFLFITFCCDLSVCFNFIPSALLECVKKKSMWQTNVITLFLNTSKPLIVDFFSKNYTLDKSSAVAPLNYLVEKYVKCIWYIEKVIIFSHRLTKFSCILITLHNFKY